MNLFFLSSVLVAAASFADAFDCASLTCSAGENGADATYKYGSSIEAASGYENQVGDLYLPSNAASPTPVVVLFHGGYWWDQYRRATSNGSSMVQLVNSILDLGFAVVNAEYRRDPDASYVGSGVPGTLHDARDVVDALQCKTVFEACGTGLTVNLDTNKIAVVGHSAGGHLGTYDIILILLGIYFIVSYF